MAAGARIRVLQGSGRKAKPRNACLARPAFVDSAGRSMVEYGHGDTWEKSAFVRYCMIETVLSKQMRSPWMYIARYI